jgi:hypothetical protein
MSIFISAIVFNIPTILLLIWSAFDIFNEFKIHDFSASFENLINKESIITETCRCKVVKSIKCPVFQNSRNLIYTKHFRERKGYPFFYPEDLRDELGMAIKLKNSWDKVPVYLRYKYLSLPKTLNMYFDNKDTSGNDFFISLKERNQKIIFISKIFLNFKKFLIDALLGEWRHPIESKWQEKYAYPPDIFERYQYHLSIELNKMIFDKTLYNPNIFVVSEDLRKLFEDYMSKKRNYSPLQLNRLLLEESFPDELRKGTYSNHVWNIVKQDFMLPGKQAHYFEIIVVQLFLLVIEPFRVGLPYNYLILAALALVILVFHASKQKPFDWFLNRYLRFIATVLAFSFCYLFYLIWVEKYYAVTGIAANLCLLFSFAILLNIVHNINCVIEDRKYKNKNV